MLIPFALKGVKYRPLGATKILRNNLLIYGVGGIIAPMAETKFAVSKFIGAINTFVAEDNREDIEFAINIETITSYNNIDDTDLLKLTTTPGYMTIETCHLTKLKDTEQFNALIQTMIDDSKSLDTEQSAKRIGIIFNGSPKTQAAIDGSFDIIKKTYGVPFELFTLFS